jgi:hypothetical protein
MGKQMTRLALLHKIQHKFAKKLKLCFQSSSRTVVVYVDTNVTVSIATSSTPLTHLNFAMNGARDKRNALLAPKFPSSPSSSALAHLLLGMANAIFIHNLSPDSFFISFFFFFP